MKGKAIVGQLALMLIAMRAAAGFMKTKLQINNQSSIRSDRRNQ